MRIQINKPLMVIGLIVACCVLFAACGSDNSTSNNLQTANISGSWTGTYLSADGFDCDTSKSLPAKATFQQNGSSVSGQLTATGPCGINYPFQGTVKGNQVDGVVSGSLNPPGTAGGVLSGATLSIGVSNGSGFMMGSMQLHR